MVSSKYDSQPTSCERTSLKQHLKLAVLSMKHLFMGRMASFMCWVFEINEVLQF